MRVTEGQLSLFIPDHAATVELRSLFDGKMTKARTPTAREKEVIPDGELVVMVGKAALVLHPVPTPEAEVPVEYRYSHYADGGQVYSGVFFWEETVD